MSVFLALVFQVLFVFFAMVINIGLLVHDKINLQNSVDLGAFYAAQKQAEILNEIAHLNYQIRQDYKLLAWRYWVLGTLGRDAQTNNPPPVRVVTNRPDAPRIYTTTGPTGTTQEEVPVACLATPYWWEFAILSPNRPPNENYCWHPYTWTSPAIPVPSVPMTPATVGANIFAQIFAQQSQANYTMSCNEASPLSWAFVAAILTDYKYSVAYKKKAIQKLRENLVSADPLDRDGRSIRDGAIATIEKNLTESNVSSFDPASVQLLNGLSRGGCEGGSTPGENTLPEILTAPGLYFALLTGNGTTCSFSTRFQTEFQSVQGGAAAVVRWDPSGVMRQLVSNEPQASSEYHSTLGFEKNPWCMAYVGLKASTSPRKPFAPFGRSVNLEARAFAQPFGGRVGPWYSKRWTRLALMSDPVAPPTASVQVNGGPAPLNPAPNQDLRTDPLTSPRLIPGSGGAYVYSSYSIPNFSRFPGDRLGLRSQLAQQSARSYFTNTAANSPASAGQFGDNRVRLNWFYGYSLINTAADTLAYDPVAAASGTLPPPLLQFRQHEASAIAPDLFDITYYSIDPAADKNYVEVARLNPARYGIAGAPMGDLGSRQDVQLLREYNISSQIQSVNSGGVNPGVLTAAYWFVRKWDHLLTGWAPHRATNFNFPTDRFGKCLSPAIPDAMIPGRCSAGGRTGYSVRLIAREHLNGVWNVGGEGAQPGTLLNPPGDDSQF